MKRSKKLEKIFRKITEFEKETPYNYCNRWCERCIHGKQMRCTLYKDELERKITCIAYGKDEDDPEITKAVMEAQYKEVDQKLSEHIDKFGIDLDNLDIDEGNLDEEDAIDFEDLPPDIQKHIQFVQSNPLNATVKKYCEITHAFLEKTFYKDDKIDPKLKNNFETVSWYYTLLPAKLNKALAGFHEPAYEGDLALYDAVAQFQIVKKAITQSVEAFSVISKSYASHRAQIQQLLVLLHNIHSRIEQLEESIV